MYFLTERERACEERRREEARRSESLIVVKVMNKGIRGKKTGIIFR